MPGRVALIAALAALLAAAAAAQPEEARRTLSVSGRGESHATPDQASVQIGVQTRHADPRRAVEENSGRVREIRARLASRGVADADVQTVNFSVSPEQDRDPQTGRRVGPITFVVDHMLGVRVRELESLGDVLAATVEAGANQIHSVRFEAGDPSGLEADARARAMADARARAEQLAGAAGVDLGAPVSIVETTAPPIPRGATFRMEAMAADVPVAPGELTVEVRVSVVYAIE